MMKVLIISGSYPPEKCGVGDYTEKLVQHLKMLDLDVAILANIDFSLSKYFKILEDIKRANPDIIHIQFPSLGYKYSIIPSLFSLRSNTIATIHEVSQFHPIRKLYLLPFSFKAKLTFTNSFEQKQFYKYFPWSKSDSMVIPIGSNISINHSKETGRNVKQIIYFGQIRPRKGLEEVIEAAFLIHQKKLDYSVKIIGQIPPRCEEYCWELKRKPGANFILWEHELSSKEISEQLSGAMIAYLPFPDGASERRGSLLAALNNKMLVFSTIGKQTPNDLKLIIEEKKSPNDFVNSLIQNDSNALQRLQSERLTRINKYLAKFKWEEIAIKHRDLYKKIIDK